MKMRILIVCLAAAVALALGVSPVLAWDEGVTVASDWDQVWKNDADDSEPDFDDFAAIIDNHTGWTNANWGHNPSATWWQEETYGTPPDNGKDDQKADFTELSLILAHSSGNGTNVFVGFGPGGDTTRPTPVKLGWGSPDCPPSTGYSKWWFIIECEVLNDTDVGSWFESMTGTHMLLGFKNSPGICPGYLKELAQRLTGNGQSKSKVQSAFFSTYVDSSEPRDDNVARIIAENANVADNDWIDSFEFQTPVDSDKLIITYSLNDVTPPAQVSILGVTNATTTSLRLNWMAPGDDGVTGRASQYDIRYSTVPIDAANWSDASQVEGEPSPAEYGYVQDFTITGLNPDTTYYFAMKAADGVPNWSPISTSPSGTTLDNVPPAAVTTLAAAAQGENYVNLYWTAPGDNGTSGMASGYDIRYSTVAITDANWASASQASGEPSPQPGGSQESFAVMGLSPGTKYYFALKTRDEAFNWSPISNSPFRTTFRVGQGDANGDGIRNMGDVIKIEKIILGLDGSTAGADANLDTLVDVVDIVVVERMILGICEPPGGGEGPDSIATVTVDAPSSVAPGSDFTVNINTTSFTSFDAANYDVTFNSSVLRLDDVTAGSIGGMSIPVDDFNEKSAGVVTVVQNLSGVTGISGSGTLAVLHFHVLGGQSSSITLSNGSLADIMAERIGADWLSDSVTINWSYHYLSKWGSYGTGNGQFTYPAGMAIDGSGNVYVVDKNNRKVQKFDPAGTYLTSWGSYGTGNGQLIDPRGIAVDSIGNVYVADTGNHRIQKFTSTGSYLTKWGSYGSGNGQFYSPYGIAIDGSNNIYVADTYNRRIQKFDSSGNYLTKWGSSGSGDGQFNLPQALAIDSTGNVYVADTSNHRIQKFNSSGGFLTKWGSQGTGDGQFNSPSGIYVSAGGLVYVSDSAANRIQMFNGTGGFITKWGSWGTGDGQLKYPLGIVVNSTHYVYVADNQNYRIQKFSPYP